MLKADLHIHTKEDPIDSDRINFTAKELIDMAAKKEFEVLAITCHDYVNYNQELAQYAVTKGILLIPGAEKTIKGKHVLLYNVTQEQIEKIKDFEDLKKIKEQGAVIAAPHPYFILPNCLKKDLDKNIELFDAIEYSSFCITIINFNKKAIKKAKKHRKTIIGNSDAHEKHEFGKTYSIINSEKNVNSVLEAIKKGKVEYKTSTISHIKFFKTAIKIFFYTAKHRIETFIN